MSHSNKIPADDKKDSHRINKEKVIGVSDKLTNNYDMEIFYIKNIWKRERNRLAAKKSREKKAKLMKEYEINEKKYVHEISVLKKALCDYDSILKEFIKYVDGNLSGHEMKCNSLLALFDFLYRYRKPDNVYIEEIDNYMKEMLFVKNKHIAMLVIKIRERLSEIWNKRRM